MMCCWGPFWTLPTAFLSGRAAAGGIALINAIANLGATLGPVIMSQLKARTETYAYGLAVMAFTMMLGGMLAVWVPRGGRRQTAPGV
jgi:MFS transporter, ACS family, tartrate transporter